MNEAQLQNKLKTLNRFIFVVFLLLAIFAGYVIARVFLIGQRII
jgi:hypothetical protein